MSLDGIAVRALSEELKTTLVGGRVDKIYQPNEETIIINIRQKGNNYKLLISINPQTARFHLTNITKKNPPHPPIFCMVLRKHLEGGKITEIKQKKLERIVHFIFEGYDEIGRKNTRILIGEFMGKHSNLILINPETNTIIDSIKRFGFSVSQYRQVLPGIEYIFPPPQNKIEPINLKEEVLIEKVINLNTNKSIAKALLELIAGIGPQTARELTIRAGIDPDTKIEFLGQYEFTKIHQQIKWLSDLLEKKAFKPVLFLDNKQPIAFAPFPLQQLTGLEQKLFSSMSKLIEYYIGQKEEINILKQKKSDLIRIIERELERCGRKLNLHLEKINTGKNAEIYKLWGELITANLYNLNQGDEAEVINFYSENQEKIIIPLDPSLTPNENAQKYFKKYNKAKIGVEKALEQWKETEEEINYLESIKNSLERVENLQDLEDIRWELEETGYIKTKTDKNGKKNKNLLVNPLTIETEGFIIYVGKNNKQNDYLTLKIAKNNDLWLHAKDIPGSHVIIKNPENKEIPQNILETAANLAAYFSKSRYSAQVPIDYTLKKYVRKPKKAKPGMVIYENQKTIFITPDEEKAKKMINTLEPGR